MRPESLVAVLLPYSTFLLGRGVDITGGAMSLDCDRLASVLLQPEGAPSALFDSLTAIDELATPERMDDLLDQIGGDAELSRSAADLGSDPTPADAATFLFLNAPERFEQFHAEARIESKRSLQYLRANSDAPPKPRELNDRFRARLEKQLAEGLDATKRGLHCRVFDFDRTDGLWFVIRRGDAFRREGAIEHNGASSVCFRPECYDTVRYDRDLGELCLPPEPKKVSALYCEAIGEHVFGDKSLFSSESKYTLEPLYEHGDASLSCGDVEGIESIRIQELRLLVGGPQKLVQTLRANDLFAHYNRSDRELPRGERALHAKFAVKFSGAKQSRVVTVRPPNSASYTRTEDAGVVEKWLAARGFISSQKRDG